MCSRYHVISDFIDATWVEAKSNRTPQNGLYGEKEGGGGGGGGEEEEREKRRGEGKAHKINR